MSFHFRVDRLFHKNAVALWIMNHQGEKTFIAEPFVLKFNPAEEGWRLPTPTLEMQSDMAMQMIRALLDALAENDWIQAKTKSQTEREAMKAHLEDMRSMSDRLLKMIDDKL